MRHDATSGGTDPPSRDCRVKDLYAGKHALVTGGTQGLGEAIARALVCEGAAGVAVVGRDVVRGERVAAELTRLGSDGVFLRADLRDPASCAEVAAEAAQRFGCIDGLVNSAASTARATLDETSVEMFDDMFAVNVRAPLLLMQAVIRDMRRCGAGGSIVNVLSMSVYGGQPHLAAYAASKGALATLTKNVAYAHRFERIRVNGLLLGWTDTPNEDAVQREVHDQPKDWLARAEAAAPMRKLAKPGEVADLVTLLLSDRGGVMTGALIDYSQDVPGGGD